MTVSARANTRVARFVRPTADVCATHYMRTGRTLNLVDTPYTQGFNNGRDYEVARRKSFLDEAIAHAKEQERQRILAIVQKQGKAWEVAVIQELIDEIEKVA